MPGQYYMQMNYEETKNAISANLQSIRESFVEIGFYLKHIRDNKMYLADGYKDIWEFAKDQYGIQRTAASRWMAINDKFSVDGNSPELLPEYKQFNKSQLQEMLYLPDEKLQEVDSSMTVKEIREKGKGENVEEQITGQMNLEDCAGEESTRTGIVIRKPTIGESLILRDFARKLIRDKKEYFKADRMNRVLNVIKAEENLKKELPLHMRTEKSFKSEDKLYHINLFEDYIQLWGDNKEINGFIGNFEWFYLMAKIQSEWNTVALEDAQKANETDRKCIHNLKEKCFLENKEKQITGDGTNCGSACCWNCENKARCNYQCYASANRNSQTCAMSHISETKETELLRQEETEEIPEKNLENIPDIEVIENLGNEENAAKTQQKLKEIQENRSELCATSHTEDDYTYKELDVKRYLVESEEELRDYIKFELPYETIRKKKMMVDGLKLLLAAEQEPVTQIQPELPIMKNDSDRIKFLDSYHDWPVWFEVKEASEVYYRYDLPDKIIVIKEFWDYAECRKNYNMDPEYTGKEYFLLNQDFHHLKEGRSNAIEIIKYLRNKER